MSWWGKVVGGTLGFMMGGPLGAIMGAAVGNIFDKGFKSIQEDESLGAGATERVQTVFFTAVFAVMGHVAKSDGKVTSDEIQTARLVMRQMNLSAKQRKVAINLFNEGKKVGFPAQQVLAQFKSECGRRRNLIRMFLEIQIATAFADGALHDRERGILTSIAGELDFSPDEFNELLNRISGQAHFVAEQSVNNKLPAAYELLGVEPGADKQTVKKAYRRQMNQYHPDKLVAKGLPEEMIEMATRKTQDIKAAYELIKSQG